MRDQLAFGFVEPQPGELEALAADLAPLAWQECTPGYAAEVGLHSYVIYGRSIEPALFRRVAQAVRLYGRREQYRVTGAWGRYLLLPEYRVWVLYPVLNRAFHEHLQGVYR